MSASLPTATVDQSSPEVGHGCHRLELVLRASGPLGVELVPNSGQGVGQNKGTEVLAPWRRGHIVPPCVKLIKTTQILQKKPKISKMPKNV